MLTQEQREFFEFFGIPAPAGVSTDGVERFMQAYLRDPERGARWRGRVSQAVPAPALPAVPAPPQPRAAPRAPPRAAAPPAATAAQPFSFSGSGGEYFGIWIVNLLLTIVTLGFYSPWAKVRRLQYFYRHTQVAGAGFDYHGTGAAILKGRLVALVLFVAYNYSFQLSTLLGVVTLALLAMVLPWLLRSSFRFRLRNSSYRGLRFRFTGTRAEAYRTFLLRPIVTLFTLYLAAPWFHHGLKRYQHGDSAFGTARFGFGARVGQFYREYLVLVVLMIVVLSVPMSMMFDMVAAMAEAAQAARSGGPPPDPQALVKTMVAALAGVTLGMLVITPLWQARMQNLVWNHTTLDGHRFASSVSAWRLLGIHLTNALAVVLTLGFFMPWAAVRVARYRAETLQLVPQGSLDEFLAAQEAEPGATGEETAEMFDIDIAL